LQEPGEHPYCGDGLDGSFSYKPEDLESSTSQEVKMMIFLIDGIKFHNFGWCDMNAPNIETTINIVRLMDGIVLKGNKILVHCQLLTSPTSNFLQVMQD
jgi:hypothetical protein